MENCTQNRRDRKIQPWWLEHIRESRTNTRLKSLALAKLVSKKQVKIIKEKTHRVCSCVEGTIWQFLLRFEKDGKCPRGQK